MQFIFSENHVWLLKVIIGLVVLVVMHLIIALSFKLIKRKSKKTNENIIISFVKPIKILIWILVLSYISIIFVEKFKLKDALKYVKLARNVALILDFTYLIIKWKKDLQIIAAKKFSQKVDKSSIELIGKILSIIISFISILIILQVIGLDIMPLVAFGGVGAAAIGFAAKDVLANFFGGFMIYLTRPFTQGDFIEVPAKNILGSVEKIGWYNTSIRELDKVPVYVPNSVFSTLIIKNKSRKTHRRLEEDVAVRYQDFSKIENIIKTLRSFLEKHPKIDKKETLSIYFTTFADFSLIVQIKAYTIVIDYKEFMDLKQELLFKVKQVLSENNADIPFPTTTIEMQK